jgi:hypothetical protein
MKTYFTHRAIAVLALLLFALCLAGIARADVTFGASVTNANGSLSTRLTWSTSPVATGCQASGHPSWTGTKAASGTLDLPAITLSGTYNLTLSCTRTGDTSALVRWTAPITNTDGTALAPCASGVTSGTCLRGYRIYRRVGSIDMNGAEMTEISDPATLTRAYSNLVAGTHNFAAEAFNANGVPSALTPIASKVISATAVENASVTLTVNPIPRAPSAFNVE